MELLTTGESAKPRRPNVTPNPSLNAVISHVKRIDVAVDHRALHRLQFSAPAVLCAADRCRGARKLGRSRDLADVVVFLAAKSRRDRFVLRDSRERFAASRDDVGQHGGVHRRRRADGDEKISLWLEALP